MPGKAIEAFICWSLNISCRPTEKSWLLDYIPLTAGICGVVGIGILLICEFRKNDTTSYIPNTLSSMILLPQKSRHPLPYRSHSDLLPAS